MKLTLNQQNALYILNEERIIELGSKKVNGNTMNSLYFKNLITTRWYANGEFWELTDKGVDEIEFINKQNKL